MGAWLDTQAGLLAELAREEFQEMIRLTDAAQETARRIGERVRVAAPALLEIHGCRELTAAKIVAEVANVDRFRSEAAFARYAGLAPVPHTSGSSPVRLRPTRQGNRRLNAALHRIAITQTIHDGPGRTYYQRRIAEGDSRHRALRSLKRRLARVVFNRLKACPPAVDDRGKNGHTLPSVFLLPLVDFQAIR